MRANTMLYWYELKKLLLTPAIIGFLALCLLLNIIIIAAYDNMEYDSGADAFNIFEGLDASAIAEGRIAIYGVTGQYADNIREKYAKLQPVIDEKAANGDALSDYLRDRTHYLHGLLFGTIFFAGIAESCLLALFLALVSVTYENTRNTENVICASKVGRRVVRSKLAASLVSSVICAAILLIVTLTAFFIKFDFSGVWGDNVSSSFNMAVNAFGKPFITWESFTVAGYFRAVIGGTLALAVCFSLLGYAVGVFAKNAYGAFIGTAVVLALMLLAKPMFPIGSVIRSAFNLTPPHLWLNSPDWFTDGAADILWANFETIGLAVSLVILVAASAVSTKIFTKRELL
ncbi:hypothetical protein FACS1894202_01650 [Clostridia bacterium]|nr:hypothetical protein FACS1894202_01650 [Clostridia bacterium]